MLLARFARLRSRWASYQRLKRDGVAALTLAFFEPSSACLVKRCTIRLSTSHCCSRSRRERVIRMPLFTHLGVHKPARGRSTPPASSSRIRFTTIWDSRWGTRWGMMGMSIRESTVTSLSPGSKAGCSSPLATSSRTIARSFSERVMESRTSPPTVLLTVRMRSSD
jgi:hypothetical protein